MSEFEEWLATLKNGDSEQALIAASQLPDNRARVLKTVAQMLEEGDPDQRWLATRSLAELKSNKAGELLQKALNDRDASVRQCAAIGLRNAPYYPAINDLIRQLGDKNQLLSRLCGDALIALGEEATPGLLTVLQRTRIDLATVEATKALAAISDPRSISALFELLSSNSAILVHWAEVGLDNLGIGMHFFEPG